MSLLVKAVLVALVTWLTFLISIVHSSLHTDQL